MLNLVAVKTKNKTYFSKQADLEKNYSYSGGLQYLLFNGQPPKKTFQDWWYYVDGDIESIQEKLPAKRINQRFILNDPSIQSDKIPLELPESVRYYDDDDEKYLWKEPYQHFESLYSLTWDTQEEEFKDVEFELNILLELDMDEIVLPVYPSYKERVYSDLIDRKQVPHHELLSKVIFPPIVEPLTPCKYTSKQVYMIVREYVKRNYNPKYCEINSDYDFCFQVNKKIPLANPHEWQQEILKRNGKSYSPKKFQTRYTGSRSVKIFEMTHAEDKYKGYTPIPEIYGDTEQDLIDKVNSLCEEIINKINEPLVECGCCKGLGVIENNEKIV